MVRLTCTMTNEENKTMTYIYQQLSAGDAVDAFRAFDRLSTADTSGNFTADEVRTLFKHYESLADGTDEPIELDVIAWCCEWAAYGSIVDAADEYDNDDDLKSLVGQYNEACGNADFVESDLVRGDILAWFQDRTTVLQVEGVDTVLIQEF